MKKEIVKVNNISYYLNQRPVLKDISFIISKGDYLSIIGANGSGKTTLIKIILGLTKPDKGEVHLFGKKLSDFSEWENIGYVPQKATSFDQTFPASVWEIVATGILSRKRFPKFLSKEDCFAIEKSLKRVGMLEHKNQKIGSLSGGQQQRVFIAKALVSKPLLLILDEPATGIDRKSQDNFYNILRDLNVKEGVTIIIISHDISFVTKYASKVACLNQTLLFHGTHDEFCSSNIIDSVLGHEKHIVCHGPHGE